MATAPLSSTLDQIGPVAPRSRAKLIWELALLLFVVAASAGVRCRLLDIPLDRDEGGYAYGGRVILRGGATYEDFYTMRYPAVFGAYAAFMALFGETHRGIHLGLLVMNALNTVFMFLLGRRVADAIGGLSTAAYFAMLSLGSGTEGFSANSEQFVILFATLGAWLLLLGMGSARNPVKLALLFLSGGAMGAAYLMKQHGAMFAAFGGLTLLVAEARTRPLSPAMAATRVCVYGAGAVLPVVATVAHIAYTGRFEDFWFWTVTYARGYATSTPLADAAKMLESNLLYVIPPMLLIWLMALAGLGGVWIAAYRKNALFLTLFALFSIAAVSIGFYFRLHYFRLLFPTLALAAGVGTAALARRSASARYRPAVAAGVVVVTVAYSLVMEYRPLFVMTPVEAGRVVSGRNPFPESIEIARYIRERTRPEDTIAVVGSEPQIYFYADRVAATGHLYTYPLMEVHPYAFRMQREMIEEIEASRPAYIVVPMNPTSWLVRPDSVMHLFEWLDPYLKRYYEQVGLVDIPSPLETHFYWDNEAAGREPASAYYVLVYHRRGEGNYQFSYFMRYEATVGIE